MFFPIPDTVASANRHISVRWSTESRRPTRPHTRAPSQQSVAVQPVGLLFRKPRKGRERQFRQECELRHLQGPVVGQNRVHATVFWGQISRIEPGYNSPGFAPPIPAQPGRRLTDSGWPASGKSRYVHAAQNHRKERCNYLLYIPLQDSMRHSSVL